MPHPQVHLLPRYRRHAVGWPLLACLVLAGGLPVEAADQGAAPPATAQVANAQATANAVAKQIREQLDASVRLLDAGDPDAGKAALTRALELLGDSAARQQRPAVIKALADRAMGIRRRFAKAGIEVPATAASEGRSPPPAARGPQVGGRATISFVQHVVPILARSCGGCHVAGKKGDFQMVSYEALMRSGMVQRGAGASSRLVEVILTGDMPRGGGKISAADVDTLTRWIDAGAVCDAPDPTMPLEALARGGGRPLPPKADVRPVKLEPGGVSFAIDVAPVLATHCLKCHGGDETENGFSLATLETLLRGGRGGAAVVAGKGGTSLLVRKLKGADIEGQRMPLDAPPLSAATIATIEKWVDEGCRLDLLTGKSPLDTVVAAGRTRSLSDDALADVRAVAAEKAWRRSIPDDAPLIERRPGVCLIGNLPAARLANLADVAVQAASAVRGDLELEPEAPLLKGGVVLFIAGKSYDYSAVWQTMLGGERPRGLTSHSGVADEVAYGALLAPSADDPADAQAAITEAVVAAAFAGRSVPEWFARGAGRTIASRLCPKAPLVRGWRSEAGPAAAAVPVDHLLSGHAADPVAAAAVAGGVVGTIGTGPRLGQMLTRLDEGMPFEAAFEQTFSMSPDQACAAWTAKAARRR